MAKARLTLLKTDQFIDLGHGPCRITPELIRKVAKENGWAVEPIPGIVGGLQAMVEINFSIPGASPGPLSIERTHG